jgi:YVTN family beta-propeller protein
MPELRDRFLTAQQIPAPDLWADVQERLAAPERGETEPRSVGSVGIRPNHRAPVQKLVTIAAAFAISIASIAIVVTAFRRSEPGIPRTAAGTVSATIPFGSGLRAIAWGEGALWVASVEDGTITRINPATNQVVATIPVSTGGDGPWDVVAGEGGVWVIVGKQAHPSRVLRIDPATNKVEAHIDVHDVSVLATGLGAVWVGQFSQGDRGHLLRIDPATNRVVATIPVGPEPQDIAVGGGAVWVLDDLTYEIVQVDPTTNAPKTVFDGTAGASAGAAGVTYEAGAIWTVECLRTGPPVSEPHPGPGCDWNLARVDTKTFTSTLFPIATERENDGHTLFNINAAVVAGGDGSVWVSIADAPPVKDGVQSFANGRLIRVDTAGVLIGTISVGKDFVGDAAIGDGSLWAMTWGASQQAAVIRIEPNPLPG